MKVLIGFSFLFVLSETILTLSKRSKQKSVKKKSDRGSLALIWIVITISFTVAFNLAHFGKWGPLNYFLWLAGVLLYFAGLILRWLTIIQLKKAFTVDVAINKDHNLKTDGLYCLVRHPSYLGILLITSGISLGMNSLLSFVIVTVPIFFAILYRVRIEEKLLTEEFGEEYVNYSKKVKRLIPFIY